MSDVGEAAEAPAPPPAESEPPEVAPLEPEAMAADGEEAGSSAEGATEPTVTDTDDATAANSADGAGAAVASVAETTETEGSEAIAPESDAADTALDGPTDAPQTTANFDDIRACVTALREAQAALVALDSGTLDSGTSDAPAPADADGAGDEGASAADSTSEETTTEATETAAPSETEASVGEPPAQSEPTEPTREDAEAAVHAALAELARVALSRNVFDDSEGDASFKTALEVGVSDPATFATSTEAIDVATRRLNALLLQETNGDVAAAAERIASARAAVESCKAEVEAAADEEALATANAALGEAEAALADALQSAEAAAGPTKSRAELERDLEDAAERVEVMTTALELAQGELTKHTEAGGTADDEKGAEFTAALAEAEAELASARTGLEDVKALLADAAPSSPTTEPVEAEDVGMEGPSDAPESGLADSVEEVVEEMEESNEEELEEARRLLERETLKKKVALVKRLQEERARKEELIQENTIVQSMIAELLRRKKGAERKSEDAAPKSVKNVSEQEARYAQLLETIKDTEQLMETERVTSVEKIALLTKEKAEAAAVVEAAQQELLAFKRKVASTVVNTRTGKRIPESQISELLETEAAKIELLREERLRYIKHRNQLQRLEAELANKEQLADGLHFIDFEQLKLTNQAHNEKIEERNVELARLKSKIMSTVQVLSHLKEKLAFTEAETESEKARLHEIEASLAKERDVVSHQKRVRDKIRAENIELEQKCGLIGQNVLLRDYEEQHDTMERTTAEIEELRKQHAAVKSRTLGYKKKLEQLQKQQPELFIED